MLKTKFFKREEFACKCGCGFSAVDAELLEVIEDVRSFFDSPTSINSACRCEAHNKSVGGKSDSMHIKGMACDIIVKDITNERVQDYLLEKYPNSKGIGSYDNFTHVDVRPTKARW